MPSEWSESRSVVSDSLQPHGLHSPWNSPGQNTGVGSLSLLQRIFPTQGLNPGLPHCRWILYQLSHKESPITLEWVSLSLLKWIFPTQESNQGLLHSRWILYQLSYQGRLYVLLFNSLKPATWSSQVSVGGFQRAWTQGNFDKSGPLLKPINDNVTWIQEVW